MPTKRALMIEKAKIDYDAYVELRLASSGALGDRGWTAFKGSLAGAVLTFLNLSEENQKLASIFCGRAVVGAGGLLKTGDIQAITRRADCPKAS